MLRRGNLSRSVLRIFSERYKYQPVGYQDQTPHHYQELTILGSLINPTTYSRAVKLAANLGTRYLQYDKLGVAVFQIHDYEQAIDQLKRGEIAKAVFKMS